MYYWISYDIENNSTRTKLAKNLEKFGAIRVQKSIFIADATLKTWQDILDSLSKVVLDKKAIDNIILISLEEHQLQLSTCLGKNEALDNLKNPPKIIFF
ncbi:MAG: CRISPR-associated endonuclease Cas2 [Bacteroidetes bacterium]|nr:MAG: CRISPR-associated endonuclease Cas2 [Bacteroidota bacterium]TAG95890.1 MAG: CRISPR-associated endonuclease Cas2 [Bacteroidota bacterium]